MPQLLAAQGMTQNEDKKDKINGKHAAIDSLLWVLSKIYNHVLFIFAHLNNSLLPTLFFITMVRKMKDPSFKEITFL